MQNWIETFRINNRINLYLLENISEEHLTDQSASKGRNVGEQFAHMHQVRLMWLKVADPVIYKKLKPIEKETLTRKEIRVALTQSGEAIAELFNDAGQKGIKGFKPHPEAFAGYLISHESHHRGQIILCLKQSGHPIPKDIQFGIWDWAKR